MATKKITGIPEIDAIARALTKKFGKDVLSLGPKIEECKSVSTGSLALDCILGVGGFPTDRIIEIFGPESAGKTSLALQLMGEFVKQNGYTRPPVFIDLERTTGLDLIRSMGIDPDKVIFCYPDTAEEALQIAVDLGRSGAVGLIVFDSVDAAQSEKETKRQMNEMGVGDLPRIMSKSLRSLSKICVDNKVCYIFINQIRMKIGVMYGNPETTSGGNALPYYASLRLRVTSKPSPSAPGVLDMKVRVKKNKLAPALNQVAEFQFICGKGIDPYSDLLIYAKDLGIIRYAGPSVRLALPDKEEITMCSGGKIGARQYLIEDPGVYSEIRKACYQVSGARQPNEESSKDIQDDKESDSDLTAAS
jgi:recombination protein RecA